MLSRNVFLKTRILCDNVKILPRCLHTAKFNTGYKFGLTEKHMLPRVCSNSRLFSKRFSTSINNRASDGDSKGDTVYIGTLTNLVKSVKIFSVSTSVIGLSFSAVMMNVSKLALVPKLVTVGSILTMAVATPLLLHWITGRYISEMHYNRETEVFHVKTFNILCQAKELRFTADDVLVPEMPGLTTITVGKKALFFDPMAVEREAYIKIMGYDKPMDFDFPEEIKEGRKEESDSK